jgi:Protein of unknown function (DUF1428)
MNLWSRVICVSGLKAKRDAITEGEVMKYVDGYVLPVPKKNMKAYRRMAQKAGKIWREYGGRSRNEDFGHRYLRICPGGLNPAFRVQALRIRVPSVLVRGSGVCNDCVLRKLACA